MKYKELKKRIRAYQETLGVANATVYKQMQHIEVLNKELDDVKKNNWNTISEKFEEIISSYQRTNVELVRTIQAQEKAIIHKDEEIIVLKRMYRDDVINNFVEKRQ